MKLSMKKNCNNCRASYGFDCSLGVPVTEKRRVKGVIVEYAPTKKCYKPLTNADYCAAIDLR